MPNRELKIFIEGDSDLRPGFSQFFKKALGAECQKHQVILRSMMGGSHSETTKKFLHAACSDTWCALLVDADAPVADGLPARDHLHQRHRRDEFATLEQDRFHLMVVQMESWLVCDIEAWEKVFGPRFRSKALPTATNIESIDKKRIEDAIDQAIRDTPSRSYLKIKHAVRLLEEIRPECIEKRAPRCRRLFDMLRQQISA